MVYCCLSKLNCYSLFTAFNTHGIMSGQAKISVFFQRAVSTGVRQSPRKKSDTSSPQAVTSANDSPSAKSTKRKLCDVNGNDGENDSVEVTASKKILTSSTEEKASSSKTLTVEQCAKVDENRIQAKMTLLKKQTFGLVTDIGTTWFSALEAEFAKPYFMQLAKFVHEERQKHTVYPLPEQVFAWTQMTHIKDVKVVILGQDPYHGPKQAHGLCFSVQKGVEPPPSLENMFQELTSDIEGFTRPNHGCLVGWAEQGVLLLNAVLTVRAHTANSHKDKGWEQFTDAVVSWLNKNTAGTVFMLWGSYAQKKGAKIDRKRHHVLQGVHPSPLSAYRGFFGCKHFSQCNKFLKAQGKKPIDWTRFI